MTFNIADPWFFALLLLLPFILAHYLRQGSKQTATVKFSRVGTIKKLPAPFLAQFRIVPLVLRIIALALIVAALARFQFGLKSQERITQGTDIIICLDTSPSMKALDFKPKSRIMVAKEVVNSFIRGRSYDRLGMVVFAGASVTVCPLTTDYQALLGLLDNVDEGYTKTDGTAIGDAIVTSVNRLKGSRAKSKVIILVTDGRSNVGMIDPISAAKLAKTMGIKIYTIGVGGKGPAPYPVEDPILGTQYVLLPEDLDEETLTEIAKITGGIFKRATDQESLKEIFAIIDKLEKTEIKTKVNVDYRELYQWFLLPALMIILLEMVLRGTVFRKIP